MSSDEEKMIEAFLKTGLSPKKACKKLEEAKKEDDERKRQQALRDFQSGLWLRNLFAFIMFLIILIALANQI